MGPISKTTLRWRDAYNPLRGANLARVAALCEAYDRGEMADVQWAFRAAERRDADLLALVERRTGSILEMDWGVKIRSPRTENRRGSTGASPVQSGASPDGRAPGEAPGPAGEAPALPSPGDPQSGDPALAAEQQACLVEAYERIDNLYEAIEHLSMAVFRGYAHVQKQTGRGDLLSTPHSSLITHLEPVDQWNVVRDGSGPNWKYNPEARSTGYGSLPETMRLEPAELVVLEHARPVDLYALPKLARTTLAEKDWTAFMDIYGVPSGVVLMPRDVPPGRERDYQEAARQISEGAPGALPPGSEYRPNDAPRGVNPFRGYLDYFTEKLVLAGTGGLLTMLAQSGSGTLAGGAHADTFRTLARGHGRRISEALQRQFDQAVLTEAFPGKPVLAYFELNFQAEADTGQVVDHALKLSQAGYQMSAAELSEKTGYELELRAPAISPQMTPMGRGDATPSATA